MFVDPQKARQERERQERERLARIEAERKRKAKIKAEEERKANQKDPDKKAEPKPKTKKPQAAKKPDEKFETITWSKLGQTNPIYGSSAPIYGSSSPIYGQGSVPISTGSTPETKPIAPLNRSPRTWSGETAQEPKPYQKTDLSIIKEKIIRSRELREQKNQAQLETVTPEQSNHQTSQVPSFSNGSLALGVAATNPALGASLLAGTHLFSPDGRHNLINGAMNLGQQPQPQSFEPPSTQSQLIAQSTPKQGKPSTSKAPLTPGQSIATWGQLNRPLIVQLPIERTFKHLQGATAYAQSLGQAAVVTKQGDHYVINPLTDDPKFPKGRFSFRRDGLEDSTRPDLNLAKLRDITPGLSAIITQDGYQIRDKGFERQTISISPDGKKTPFGEPVSVTLPAFHTDPLEANYAGQREAFGIGLGNLKDKEQFLKQYKLSLRESALSLLDTSAKEAKQKQRLFANGMPPSEAPKIHKVATSLETIDKQLAEAKSNSLWTDIGTGLSSVDPITGMPRMVNPSKYEAQTQTHQQVQQLEAQRAALLTQYPLLSRINSADFNKLTPQEQAKSLHEACGGVLTDIQTTRQNIIKDKLNLWQLAPLVATTTNGLGIQPEQMEWIAEKIKSDKTWDVASKVGIAALSIGLAVGGTLLGGPVGTAMAWGAFGTGVVGAATETDQYFTNQAGANTSIDPNKSVVPQDMKGHWGWVVASWVGVGLDFGAAVQATRMMKAGMEAEQVAKLIGAQKAPVRGLEAGDAAAKTTALEDILKQSLPQKFAGQADNLLKTPQILKPEEFVQKFGSESADAVTTFTKGKDGVTRAQVFFREGGNPLAMREEAVHISQLAEGGDIAKKINLLTEENLSKWPRLSMEQRLDIYKAKIEVEIDAQQRLLKQFGEGDPKYVKSVQHNLDNLQSRMAEVDLGVKNPKSVQDADWLQEEKPRLFSKSSDGSNSELSIFINELIKDSNKKLPLSEVNARKILTDLAPEGFKPKSVAGSGGPGADVIFEGPKGQTFKIENKSTTSFRSFDSELSYAAQNQASGNLVFVQVPENTDVSKWLARFWGNRKDFLNSSTPENLEKLEKYKSTEVIILDVNGTELLPRQPIYSPFK